MVDLASYIKEKRAKRDLSLRKLADLSDISHTEIKRIEDGVRQQPSPSVLRTIAVALNVPYEEIMTVAGYVMPTVAQVVKPVIKGSEDLSQEEIAKVEEYVAFIKTQRK